MSSNFMKLVAEANARFTALSPEQQEAHREAQRASFVRAFTFRCEHGMADFEQCGECRRRS